LATYNCQVKQLIELEHKNSEIVQLFTNS